jgi:uncharacterized protein YgbK (DUF1537 family)
MRLQVISVVDTTSSAARAPAKAVPMATCELTDLDSLESQRDELADLARIRAINDEIAAWTVVLDDDPTGTQTTSNVPIVMGDWDANDLAWATACNPRITFVLTNTRAQTREQARATTRAVVAAALRFAGASSLTARLVSRSDSTLRGHFEEELSAIADRLKEAGQSPTNLVFAPAFVEAGRHTARDTQWVTSETSLIPAAHTEFARDTTFGYDEVSLTQWVKHRRPAASDGVDTIPLEVLRADDAEEVICSHLTKAPADHLCISEGVRGGDLVSLVLGCLRAEREGHRIVYRVGPSAVRAFAGTELPAPVRRLPRTDLTGHHGLVVVGSHTDLTNEQVDELSARLAPQLVELNVSEIAYGDSERTRTEIQRAAGEVVRAVGSGFTVFRTARDVVVAEGEAPMLVTQRVASAVAEVVRIVCSQTPLGFLVGKGGITSSDIPTRALQVTRAEVLGQMFPGAIPAWRLVNGTQPGLPYIVFPGNVGDRFALASVVSRLTGAEA